MKLYRYYDGRVGVHLMEFNILKETKCGVWIRVAAEQQKFVNLQANKKYAYKTKEEAKVSFIARKRRQIGSLAAQIERAKKAIFVAEEL